MPIKTIIKTLAALILLPYSSLVIADTYDPLDFERPSSWYFTFAPGVTALKGSQLQFGSVPGIDPPNLGVLTYNLQPGYNLGYNISTGFGFHLDHNFRIDLLYSYMNNASRRFDGTALNSIVLMPEDNLPVKGNDLNILTHTLMTNLYYDFYPYNMPVYPYVGLGLGLAFTKASSFTLEFPTYLGDFPDIGKKVSIGNSGFDTKFAYQATIGFQKMIHDNFWVDIHYKWLNVAIPKFFNHRMQVHTIGLGLNGYLPDSKRGRFTAEYDDVIGYLRTWYIHAHGGLNYFMNNDTRYTQFIIPAQVPDYANGATEMVNNVAGTQYRLGYDIGGAVGFYMNDWTRVEVEFSHNHARNGRTEGAATLINVGPGVYRATGFVNVNSFMVNGYYDFINVGRVYKPYVGVGVGIARVRHGDLDGFHNDGGGTITLANVPANVATRFAFQIHTGARKRLNNHWLLQYGYRYFVVPRPSVFTHAIQNHAFSLGLEYTMTPPDEEIS